MPLNYLDFEYSEDADGNGTLDAMASVLPAQLPALQSEIAAVLAWAHAHWPGACAPLEDGGAALPVVVCSCPTASSKDKVSGLCTSCTPCRS